MRREGSREGYIKADPPLLAKFQKARNKKRKN